MCVTWTFVCPDSEPSSSMMLSFLCKHEFVHTYAHTTCHHLCLVTVLKNNDEKCCILLHVKEGAQVWGRTGLVYNDQKVACLEAGLYLLCLYLRLLEHISSIISFHQSYLTFRGENCQWCLKPDEHNLGGLYFLSKAIFTCMWLVCLLELLLLFFSVLDCTHLDIYVCV